MGCGGSRQAPDPNRDANTSQDMHEQPITVASVQDSGEAPATVPTVTTISNENNRDLDPFGNAETNISLISTKMTAKSMRNGSKSSANSGKGSVTGSHPPQSHSGLESASTLANADNRVLPHQVEKLKEDFAKFLVSYTTAILDGSGRSAEVSDSNAKPHLESRTFKPHTMDNVRVRKMCDEMIFLQDPSYVMKDDESSSQPNPGTRSKVNYWMTTLRVSVGSNIHSIDMRNQPNVSVGGYFILAQMMAFVHSLLSLDLSSNGLRAAEARVLALGLLMNKSVQDLRENGIRGSGVCALADGLSNNSSLTHVDVRWNYVGESSDYVEKALVDLKQFCLKNRQNAFRSLCKGARRDSLDLNAFPSNGDGSLQLGGGSKGGFSSYGSGLPPAIPTNEAPIGKMEVTIIGARNLPQVIWSTGHDGEFWGQPQAYCTCSINNETIQTKVVGRSFNPEWNESCNMKVAAIWNMVALKVKHSMKTNKTSRDDTTVGMVCIPAGFVINWRGVTNGLDNTFKAIYRTITSSKDPSKVPAYKICKVKDKTSGNEVDTFDTKEAAARAYDETALHIDGDDAMLNFTGKFDCIGQDMKEAHFPLVGEDGVRVLGVQAGVYSEVILRLKFFAAKTDYIEILLERATSLPKMDSGLGTCDAYIMLIVGDYQFRSRVVRNSLDPEFKQTFRIAAPRRGEKVELRLELFDWDRFDADDHMGDSVLELAMDLLTSKQLDAAYYVTKVEDDGQPGEQYLTNAKGEKSAIHLKFNYFEHTDSDSDDEDEEDDDELAAEI